MGASVTTRCFLHLTGYEPVDGERARSRFAKELARFARTWNVTAAVTGHSDSADGLSAAWTIAAEGPNWRVATEHVYLRWDDFVTADFAQPDWRRFPRAFVALADFIVSGTLAAYIRTSWRYAIFFFFPIIIVTGFVLGATLLTVLAFWLLWLPWWLAPVLILALTYAAIRLIGPAAGFNYQLDDWVFARDFACAPGAEVEARIDRFARELVDRARAGADELIVSGQSLGAAWGLVIVDRALRLDPELGRRGTRVWLLTTGSSILKVGLHPAATWLRAAAGRVAAAPDIGWAEYQAIADILNFYKTDPVAAMGHVPCGKPVVHNIRIRDMVEAETYRGLRGTFFQMHRRFVMANERRYFYDYFMICCGPLPLDRRIADPESGVVAFDAQGAFDQGEAAPRAPAAAQG